MTVCERDALGPHLQLAAGDARHVEQVVEQARHVRDLAFDDADAPRPAPGSQTDPPPCAAARGSAPADRRNSCASVARNSSLRRSAGAAAILRGVGGVAEYENHADDRPWSRIGAPLSSIGTSCPVLVRMSTV